MDEKNNNGGQEEKQQLPSTAPLQMEASLG